ncbi:MAG: MFS transporter [Bacteroidaceae bacterium]|nr:MFS transporter [Bacteroidaceae bacterium]
MTIFKKNRGQRATLFMLFSLYIAQTIPMSFFSTAIPVMMRQEHFSLSVIGLLQLIKLPWIIKFIWAPAVDTHCKEVKNYKHWIFMSEVIYASFLFIIAFLNITTDFKLIVVLVLLSLLTSATQDIATDSLAIRLFDKKGKSLSSSMQSMGSFAGAMIGGGLLLVVLQRYGWDCLLLCLGVFVLLAIIPLWKHKHLKLQHQKERKKAKPIDILSFFTQKGIWKQVTFLLLFYAGIVGTLAMLRPYLVDLGYDLKQIGLMSGVLGTSGAFLTSWGAGLLVRRIGRAASRLLFGGCILFAALYFVGMSSAQPTTLQLYIGILLLWGSYGAATIIVYTMAMDKVRPGREGTDFTIQIVLTHLSSIIMAVGSGHLAQHIGYHGLFIAEALLAALSLSYVLLVYRKDFRCKKKKRAITNLIK